MSHKTIVMAIVTTGLVLAGCTSTQTIQEIDPATGKVVKITTITESDVAKLVESTKNKSIIAWDTGWLAGIKYTSTPTTDNPTFFGFEALGGKQHKGYMSIKAGDANALSARTWEGIAKVIQATDNSTLTLSTSGITESKTAAASQCPSPPVH
ncbi:MAG: hypothetical protein PHQ27_04255 [Victivallales bacterium]|nr:hypothetical protein [Victivallales bacterium]